MNQKTTYVIISPVRDEEAHLERTARCVVAQAQPPVRWIIVDDGSGDRTGEIADRLAASHDWITAVHRTDRGKRLPGGGVVDAFYDGFRALNDMSWDYIVKMDGDVSFEPDYFVRCLARFEQDPSLGIAGGVIQTEQNGLLAPEDPEAPAFHVRGATKIYRRACWVAIGGLRPASGWDTLDEVTANMLGWRTRTLTDIPIVHHRSTGAAQGPWRNGVKNGRGSYAIGYHPLFMLGKCARRLFRKASGIGAAGMAFGFFSSYLKFAPRVAAPDVRRYLRGQQWRKLCFRDSIWQ